VKTPDGTRLKHHLVAEKKYGRRIDTNFERVIFKDGDRKNFDEDNIEVVLKKAETRKVILERIDERIVELQERKAQLLAEEAAEQSQADAS
jgi:transcriptional regulator NrdR family protein